MIVDTSLFLCLSWVLVRADWNRISLDSIKRQLREDRVASGGSNMQEDAQHLVTFKDISPTCKE